MNFDIRSATLDDVAKITRLHVDSWKDTYPFMPAEVQISRSYAYRYEEWLEALSNPDPDQLILTLWDGETLAAFCNCNANHDPDLPEAKGELHAMYFHKKYRYRGHIANLYLIDRMIRFLLKRDLWPASMWCFEQNPFRRTYKDRGFIERIHRDRIIAGIAIPEVGYLTPEDPAELYVKMNDRLRRAVGAELQMTPPARPPHHPVPVAGQTDPETLTQNLLGQD